MADAFIKISRKIMEWEWYKNTNTCRLFFHMLLKANWKDGRFEGQEIKRGSFVSSIRKLAHETSLTEKEVRTALKHLKWTGEVASQATSKYTVFTVSNYDLYQTKGTQMGEQRASKGQAKGKQRATIEEYKEVKNIKNNIKESGKFVPPTLEEIQSYCCERKNNIDGEQFQDFYQTKNWMVGKNKMKDWKACIRTWERRTVKDKAKPCAVNQFEQRNRSNEEMKSIEMQLLKRG